MTFRSPFWIITESNVTQIVLVAGEVITQLLLMCRGGQRAQVSQGIWPWGHKRRRPSEDRGIPFEPSCAEPVPITALGVGGQEHTWITGAGDCHGERNAVWDRVLGGCNFSCCVMNLQQ